ncbi:hypothetical protein [Candidatus Parabeggiatoa sp. HSG14]|uniref:hypothetical protein n=1 Tax=Candidatus Parabeggiatoa sp. HSG14 TaxID=3055593 RepID=UPI0025A83E04|nr:hypothetical protein [Thiotrichales bacterium HSG14]
MLSIEGIYQNGRVELAEMPFKISEPTHVIITFLESKMINLQTRNIDKSHATDLRTRLSTFAQDWEKPEMNIYDDYDANKSNL